MKNFFKQLKEFDATMQLNYWYIENIFMLGTVHIYHLVNAGF